MTNALLFVEHMLFMGSEKHPDENSYEKYLAEVRSMSNSSKNLVLAWDPSAGLSA
jgi:hypothetical protein